jgi:hypothetical protein
MSLITGSPFTDRASVEATGWDVDALVRRSADIYMEMIFRDGLYHADPHPGNFLIPDDAHLAILDFGDVGRVSSSRRLQLESLVIAVGTRDVDALVDVVVEMTTPPPSIDMKELRADIEAWLNRYLLVGVGQLDMPAIIDSGMAILHRHKLVLPADLALLFRSVGPARREMSCAPERTEALVTRPSTSWSIVCSTSRTRKSTPRDPVRNWSRMASTSSGRRETRCSQPRTERAALRAIRCGLNRSAIIDLRYGWSSSVTRTSTPTPRPSPCNRRRTGECRSPVSSPPAWAWTHGSDSWRAVKRRGRGSPGHASSLKRNAADRRSAPCHRVITSSVLSVDDHQRHRHGAEELAHRAGVKALVPSAAHDEETRRPAREVSDHPVGDAHRVRDGGGRHRRHALTVDASLDGAEVHVGSTGGP